MNILWNIIKKDLSHNWLTLGLLYLVGFVSHTAEKWPSLSAHSSLPAGLNSIKTVAGLAGAILFLIFTGAVIQEDPAATPSSFWRTRPLTSFQMLLAKGLILVVFTVIGPPIFGYLTFSLVKCSFSPIHLNAGFLKPLFIGCASLAVSAAIAAATKNLSQYFLAAVSTVIGFLGLFMAFGATKMLLLGPPPFSHVMVTALIIIALGATAFCQQYLARQTWISVMLLICCPAVFALLLVWR